MGYCQRRWHKHSATSRASIEADTAALRDTADTDNGVSARADTKLDQWSAVLQLVPVPSLANADWNTDRSRLVHCDATHRKGMSDGVGARMASSYR